MKVTSLEAIQKRQVCITISFIQHVTPDMRISEVEATPAAPI